MPSPMTFRPTFARVLTAAALVAALVALAFVPVVVPLGIAGLVAFLALLWIGPALELTSARVLGMRRWPEATAIAGAVVVMVTLVTGRRWRYAGMAAAWLVVAAACVAWRERREAQQQLPFD